MKISVHVKGRLWNLEDRMVTLEFSTTIKGRWKILIIILKIKKKLIF